MSYSAGRIDHNKAKIAAYVVVAGFLAIMFVFGLRSATGPELHDGDKVESLTCPVCQGSGDGKEAGTRCQACLGSKNLKAVVPGPLHPVDVRGTVRDMAKFKDQAEADAVVQKDALDRRVSLKPVTGSVADAHIVFVGKDGQTEFTSKATGRFWGVITPGSYQLSVTAPGFRTLQKEITVEPRQKPIWPEVGGLDQDDTETLQLDLMLTR